VIPQGGAFCVAFFFVLGHRTPILALESGPAPFTVSNPRVHPHVSPNALHGKKPTGHGSRNASVPSSRAGLPGEQVPVCRMAAQTKKAVDG